ncbi:MAG: hypothetical protein QME79_12415 [Bacillota bacterium]|nr:hypothetical protein [Bacillota bacterium]
MSRYAKVQIQFWRDEKIVALSEDERNLFLYLLTCPHGNAVGLFVLPDAYACGDLRWPRRRYSKALGGLLDRGFVVKDDTVQLIWLPNYLKHNPIENPSQAAGAIKAIQELPRSPLCAQLAAKLKQCGKAYLAPVAAALEARSPGQYQTQCEAECSTQCSTQCSTPVTVSVTVSETVEEDGPVDIVDNVDNSEAEVAAVENDEERVLFGLLDILGDRDIGMDPEAVNAVAEAMLRRGVPLRVAEIAADLTVELAKSAPARGAYFETVMADWLNRGTLTVAAAEASAERAREKAKLRAGPPRARSGTR